MDAPVSLVQGGGGLIGDHQLRITGQCHGNHDALPHAAAHLMRVVGNPRFGCRDADELKHIDHSFAGYAAG
jgi:hypothetical protein